MQTATWLHLSDLHLGAPGHARDWPTVQDAFARDLDQAQKAPGPPDVVLFTGDLAWSGQEYDKVAAFLSWLDTRIGQRPVFANRPAEIAALLPRGADDFRSHHHLVLLLQHHPPDWLSDPPGWEARVEVAGHITLFGHMHDYRAPSSTQTEGVSRVESNEPRARVLVLTRGRCWYGTHGVATLRSAGAGRCPAGSTPARPSPRPSSTSASRRP